jgi:hypothetical protein
LLAHTRSGILATHRTEENAMPRLEPDPYSGAKRLVARTYDSDFPEAHDSYNSMGTGSDGRIYHVLSSESLDRGAQMFAFDPQRTESIKAFSL